MTDYFTFITGQDAEHCALGDEPKALEGEYRLSQGISVGDDCPAGEKFPMSSDNPAFFVPDVVDNLCGYFIVSLRLKALLEKEANAKIEFLPIVILNHKGRVASKEHVIANPLGTVDCVDLKLSEGTPNELEAGTFHSIKRLVLDPKRIPKKPGLFRIHARPRVLVVRDDLRQAMDAAGITGITWQKVGDKVSL